MWLAKILCAWIEYGLSNHGRLRAKVEAKIFGVWTRVQKRGTALFGGKVN